MRRAAPLSLAGAALALLPGRVAIAGDGESALGLSAAFASLTVTDHNPAGGGLVLDYQRGLTDVLWLRGAVLGGVLTSEGGTSYVGQGTVGITYALDILKYIPYVNLGLGAVMIDGGGLERAVHPEIELGLGLDVLVGRSASYGPFVRMAAFADESALLTVGLRASYRWGFF